MGKMPLKRLLLLSLSIYFSCLLILCTPAPARAGDLAWSDPAKLPPPPAGTPGYPSRDPNLDVRPGFVTPPAGYGEIPFWWWIGDTLTKERIAWQLDQLKDNGISGLQVNYCHTDAGGRSYGLTFPSDPKLFTNEWWGIYNWTLAEAKKRGMAVSLSDYTLGLAGQGAYIDEILKDNPGLLGHVLTRSEKTAGGGKPFTLELPEGTLSVTAIPLGTDNKAQGAPLDLTAQASGGRLQWTAPGGHNWKVVAVQDKAVPLSIDPMDPRSGKETIRTFYQRFEDQNPGEAGKGLNYFFSDELQFGVSGNLWNARFAGEFKKRKGYDLLPELAAIFTDIGPRTPKVRLDYYDVLVALSEESYFRPVFQWHYDRGMLYGCDHGGRGKNVTEFGDYFRTQRWMTGPGCDQPRLAHDVIKNKVASSIAHLYQRPRAWSEEFHSTGWAANTDDMTHATNENWVSGMNLITLHGLYYTTHGGWWEWAPPCFHFRMPYWPHMGDWLRAYQRLSYILSQGVHRADVAILYPVAPLQAGTSARPARGQRAAGNDAVSLAFAAGQDLFDKGIDFDFMDEESLARSEIRDKALNVSGEIYRVLILPSMSALHQSTLDQALKFYRNGGIVLALGDLPEASDRAGRDDKELDAQVKEIFGMTAAEARASKSAPAQKNAAGGFGLRAADLSETAQTVAAAFPRDFEIAQLPAGAKPVKPHVLHRHVGARDVYFVTQAPKGAEGVFRATGKAELWDFWTGQTKPLPVISVSNNITRLRMPLTEAEGQLIVFSPGQPELEKPAVAANAPTPAATLALDGDWEFELKPTLDNRFGDFRLPVTAANKVIGAEARRFAVSGVEARSAATNTAPGFDDSKWPVATYSYAPYFYKLGPLAASAETPEFEAQLAALTRLDPNTPIQAGGKSYPWQPYDFSLREGIWNEPGHEGYHGLKEAVSDDFIALGRKVGSRTKKNDVDFVAEPGGTRYYLWTRVVADQPVQARTLTGDYKPAAVWIGGKLITDLSAPVAIPAGGAALLLRYDQPGRGHFILQAEGASSAGQPYPLAMTWYTLPGLLRFDPQIASTEAIRFTAPPAVRNLAFAAHGANVRAYLNGKEAPVTAGERRADGATEYTIRIATPDPRPAAVALTLEPRPGYPGAAAFPEPIRLDCAAGRLPAGDWSKMGVLETYSGGAWYRKTVTLTPEQARQTVTLNLGNVISTAEVHVNGKKAGVRMFAPWTLDITPFAKPGENRIEILVYSTLANHYATIPTKYRGELTAGLLGPVALEFR